MPENNPQAKNISQVKLQQLEISSGPIPSPQILQQYNQIVPDAAEGIIKVAEKQSDHRIDLERKVVESNIIKSYVGMGLRPPLPFMVCISRKKPRSTVTHGRPLSSRLWI